MDFASVNRQRKVVAMAAAFDAMFRRRFPGLDPHDQGARIADATREWTDEHWLTIARAAGYKSEKTPGPTTRAMFVEIYLGRARTPLAPAGRQAS